MPRKSNGMLFLFSLMDTKDKDNITQTSGTCAMCDKYNSLLVHDKTAADSFPTCIKCLKNAVGALRSD
jgi:hypothetical protein